MTARQRWGQFPPMLSCNFRVPREICFRRHRNRPVLQVISIDMSDRFAFRFFPSTALPVLPSRQRIAFECVLPLRHDSFFAKPMNVPDESAEGAEARCTQTSFLVPDLVGTR